MCGKNRNKKVGLCLMAVTTCLVLAGLWAVLTTPGTALAKKPPKPPSDGERTAMVTISGPMQSAGPHSFGLGETNQTLALNSWIGIDRGAPVPISCTFAKTVDVDAEGYFCEGDDLKGHLVDTLPLALVPPALFPYRWQVVIQVDISSLDGVGSESTTNYNGGHSIDIWTDPDDYRAQTPTITDTPERLWIPEGPSRSGLVTVKWVLDDTDDSGTRTRVFEFTSEKIQVVSYPKGSEKKDKPRKWMRCDNLDGPIEVTVVTTL
ncbi:MAG: hypothetical protein JSW66_05215 [Phycisphaerales bacterium]|nr:MAG: hypothetical protein JSW66_05215 [Phycisphaerales bacterium]